MYSSLSQIPPLIRDRCYVPAIDELHAIFLEQYSLSQKQYAALRDVEDAVLLGSVVPADISPHLRDVGIPDASISDITRLLVSRYFILFQDFLGDMSVMMTSLGISKEVTEAYVREALAPHNVLPSFIIDYFSEANIVGLPKESIYACIDTLLDLVNQQATSSMIQMHMETALAGQLSEEERMYIIKTIQDDIQAEVLIPQWAWYHKTLADNVINTSVALYDQPILPILRQIDRHESLATQAKEYWYLYMFSRLDIEAQRHIVSQEWKQTINDYEEQSGYVIYPSMVSYALGEYTLEEVVSILKQKYSLEVEDASIMQKKIIELMSSIHTDRHDAVAVPTTPSFGTSQDAAQVPAFGPSPLVIPGAQNSANEGKLPAIPEATKAAAPVVDYDVIIDRILKDAALTIEDPNLLTKVRAILLTRVRGIRDAIDTRESLRELFAKPGSKLDAQSAILFTKEANKYADMLLAGNVPEFAIVKPPVVVEPPKPVTPETPAPVVPSTPAPSPASTTPSAVVPSTPVNQPPPPLQTISSPIRGRSRTQNHPQFGVSGRTPSAPVKTPAPQAEQQKQRFAIEEVEGVPMIVEKSAASVPTAQAKPIESKPMPIPTPMRAIPTNTGPVPGNLPFAPTIQNQTRPIVVRQGGMPSPHKVNLTDVKMAAPRLMDPVEELRTFTVKDFRRLSTDPLAAIKTIYQKIKLLEKDSASRKVAGINAWKANEVSALYGAIGQESFGAGKKIQDTIVIRTQQEKPTLTEPEFDALMELNEMMRF